MSRVIKKCRISGKEFVISEDDRFFYEKIGVPPPTLCPEERQRRRLVWRNERHLFKRVCDLCADEMISIYPEDCSFPVYCERCFFSSNWDPSDYKKDFDLERSFFEQFAELNEVVPRLAITHAKSKNSNYSLNGVDNKNCYLTSGADHNQSCMYGISSQRSKNCVDTFFIYDSEDSYASLDSIALIRCTACQDCENISDSWFLYDCKDCKHCAFSSNLNGKEYVLFNKQLSESSYQHALKEELSNLFKSPDWIDSTRRIVKDQAKDQHLKITNNESVRGYNARNCKNSYCVFDVEFLENCKYVFYGAEIKNGYDLSCVTFECENFYEVMSACNGKNVMFTNASLFCSDLQYCITCFESSFLFACIGIRSGGKYMILNKQYEKEDFFEMRKKIIEHMIQTREYGEYFPSVLSPFGYNESAAADFLPLDKEKANRYGYLWYEDPEAISIIDGAKVKDCIICRKNFDVLPEELKFYEKIGVPEPEFCWACRLKRLIDSRRPWQFEDCKHSD